jgi:hypothetical protein
LNVRAASITDFIPDAHTFIVVQATVLGKTCKKAA